MYSRTGDVHGGPNHPPLAGKRRKKIVAGTRVNNKHLDSCLSIENYMLIRRDRIKRKGGGVCAYIRNDIKYEIFQCDGQANNIEIVWLKVFLW